MIELGPHCALSRDLEQIEKYFLSVYTVTTKETSELNIVNYNSKVSKVVRFVQYASFATAIAKDNSYEFEHEGAHRCSL